MKKANWIGFAAVTITLATLGTVGCSAHEPENDQASSGDEGVSTTRAAYATSKEVPRMHTDVPVTCDPSWFSYYPEAPRSAEGGWTVGDCDPNDPFCIM